MQQISEQIRRPKKKHKKEHVASSSSGYAPEVFWKNFQKTRYENQLDPYPH